MAIPWDEVTHAHVLEAMESARQEVLDKTVPASRASTNYCVVHPTAGWHFPPKYVVGRAVGLARGGADLGPEYFFGGAPTNQGLEALGFTVVSCHGGGLYRDRANATIEGAGSGPPRRVRGRRMAQELSRRYWAFFANPRIYRIEAAVRALTIDTWMTKGKPVRAGDRVAIWRGAGTDGIRGVVALGEVLTDPAPGTDADNPFWVRPPAPDEVEERALVRYVVPPGLPLLTRREAASVLDALSVSRARGGTVFVVPPDQWAALVGASGGWPSPPTSEEVDAAQQTVEEQAGRRPVGQGFQVDPRVRQAIEARAMALAERHYAGLGWTVTNVSARASYDLHCTRPGGAELRVEVKGTTGDGTAVLLTPKEVDHARRQHPRVALFVAAGIRVVWAPDGSPQAVAGAPRVYEPWQIDDGVLTALGYSYVPPTGT